MAITIGALLMLFSLAAIAFYLKELKEHINIAIALISTSLFGFQFLINNLQTLPSDYYNGKNVGTVSGMGGTAAVAGTIILTFMVPSLTRTNYTMLFVFAAIMVPLSWFCVTFISAKNDKLTAKI
jgi:ACS family hexuronate transporter-like MFS transporter